MDLVPSPSNHRTIHTNSNSKSLPPIDQAILSYLNSPLKKANLTFGELVSIERFGFLNNPSIKEKACQRLVYLEHLHNTKQPSGQRLDLTIIAPSPIQERTVTPLQKVSPDFPKTTIAKYSSPSLIQNLLGQFERMSTYDRISSFDKNKSKQLDVS